MWLIATQVLRSYLQVHLDLQTMYNVIYLGMFRLDIYRVCYNICYKYILCLSVWVSVCLYPINVKTAEPIGSNFFFKIQFFFSRATPGTSASYDILHEITTTTSSLFLK